MTEQQRSGRARLPKLLAVVLALSLGAPCGARAGMFVTFVTGEDGATNTIFRVVFDPAVAGSAAVTPVVTDVPRLDGIDFVPGMPGEVVVGAQTPGIPDDGAITHYNVVIGMKLPDYISSTNGIPGAAASKPSTVLSTPAHVYYVENQFGFAVGGTAHRVMRTPFAGPPDMAEVVFDGAAMGALGLRNFEGLEIIDGRLYFFAEDDGDASKRALYSIGLDGAGIWDGSMPAKHLGGLTGTTDGSDELDFDPVSALLYGTNIVSGEVIFWDPMAMAGGFLISPGDILAAPGGSDLARLGTARTDGIRPTPDGFLVLTGLDGVILSIDIAGAMAGVDDGDLKILYDDDVAGMGYTFDDLTPLSPAVPEPSALTLFGLGCLFLVRTAWVRRVRRSVQ